MERTESVKEKSRGYWLPGELPYSRHRANFAHHQVHWISTAPRAFMLKLSQLTFAYFPSKHCPSISLFGSFSAPQVFPQKRSKSIESWRLSPVDGASVIRNSSLLLFPRHHRKIRRKMELRKLQLFENQSLKKVTSLMFWLSRW